MPAVSHGGAADLRANGHPATSQRRISGLECAWVNSLHHQSVDHLGDRLRVSARNEHGIVQAIEREATTGSFLIGVHWHPEFLPYRKEHRRIFQQFVDTAASAAGARPANQGVTSALAP
ncbi:MAG: gamma-glutamyl-gamma-aminobutyrate hydrolase family protein [Pseudomonadota bacterium]